MMRVTSAPDHAHADCVTCADAPPPDMSQEVSVVQRWARRHVTKHPTHKVYVEQSTLRVYRGDDHIEE